MPALADLMSEICRQQHGQYIVTGFYLTRDQLTAVAHSLEPDVSSPGSGERFRDVPIYLVDQTPVPAGQQNQTLRGIQFTYFLLDYKHPLHVDFGLLDLEDQLKMQEEAKAHQEGGSR
jgi:hypothetical protein